VNGNRRARVRGHDRDRGHVNGRGSRDRGRAANVRVSGHDPRDRDHARVSLPEDRVRDSRDRGRVNARVRDRVCVPPLSYFLFFFLLLPDACCLLLIYSSPFLP
jgi:hypothetical protein